MGYQPWKDLKEEQSRLKGQPVQRPDDKNESSMPRVRDTGHRKLEELYDMR